MNTLASAIELTAKHAGSKVRITWGSPSDTAGVSVAAIEKVIKRVCAQLPSLTTVAVVEVATGACLAHLSHSRGFDAAGVASHNAGMVRQKQLAMAALGMRGERLEDILIPFRKQLHLIRLARNGQWFGYLAVKTQDTSLALAREILKSIIP